MSQVVLHTETDSSQLHVDLKNQQMKTSKNLTTYWVKYQSKQK